jgi:hypothetical protein
MYKNLTTYFAKNPKQLLLLDALGALVSGVGLFLIRSVFLNSFGVPKPILQLFLIIAIGLSFFSFISFLLVKKNISVILAFIAFANFLYCILIAVLLLKNSNTLRLLGFIYFVIEISIIATLAIIEFKTAYLKN